MTFELDNAYQIDAVIMVGEWWHNLVGPFRVFVGFYDDYTLNDEC